MKYYSKVNINPLGQSVREHLMNQSHLKMECRLMGTLLLDCNKNLFG